MDAGSPNLSEFLRVLVAQAIVWISNEIDTIYIWLKHDKIRIEWM